MSKNYCVIFDLDNTLVITRPAAKVGYKQAINYVADRHGISDKRFKLYNHWKKLVQNLKKDLDPAKRQFGYSLSLLLSEQNIPDTYLPQALKRYQTEMLKNLTAQNGANDLLSWLKEEGHTIAVATNSLQADAKKKLKQVDLHKYIDHIIAPNHTGTMKPSEKFYQLVLEKTGCGKESAIVVGDSKIEDVEPAKKMGLKTIQVPHQNFHLGEVKEKLEKIFT